MQGAFVGHCQLVVALDTGDDLLNLAAQTGRGCVQVGASGGHRGVTLTIAARHFFVLGPRLGFFAFELLDQWVAQHSRNTGQAFPVAFAHRLNLAVLAFGFSTLTAGVDHAVARQRQLSRANGAHTIHVDQVFCLAIGLQAVFRIFEFVAQLTQAAVHPVGRGHGHFHGGFQLAFDKTVSQGVGCTCGHLGVGHVHLYFDQLALALRLDADALHEGQGDFVEDFRFSG